MADIGLAKGAEERGHQRAALDAASVRDAYRRWAGVYDTVFGGVSGFGRRRAVAAVNRLSGVRVIAHKETPGLGDYIDPKKDRRKDGPWIGQFSGATWTGVNTAEWTVRKDGGSFDYRAGATISARAVTRAVGRITAFATGRLDALFAAPAGSQLGEES